MKLALPLIAILLAFNWYVVPVNNSAVSYTDAEVNEIADSFAIALQGSPWDFSSTAHKRPAKLFYDRIEIGVEPVRVQRCKPGLVWRKDNCWRLERLAKS